MKPAPLSRIQIARSEIIYLYYDVVPDANSKGHPGARGNEADTRTKEQIALDEIVDTIKEIRPFV